MLVGREEQLATISSSLHQALGSVGSVFAVRGVPGVGKSAFFKDAASAATEAGFHLVRTAGFSAERTLPYVVLGALIEQLLPIADGFDGLGRSTLSGLLESPTMPERASARTVGFAFLELVRHTSVSCPVCVFVDDAHHADDESMWVVSYVARRIHRSRVVILISLRPDEITAWDQQAFVPINLSGLDLAQSTELLREHGAVSSDVARTLHEGTDGNALALRELGRRLSSDELRGHAPVPEPLPVGDGIAAMYGSDLAHLPARTRHLLLIAATAGPSNRDALWAVAARHGLTADDAESAERAGLVRFVEGGLSFRHPLVRAAVYERADPTDRRHVHLELAEYFNVRDPDRAAIHLLQGSTVPDGFISDALRVASDRARRRGLLRYSSRLAVGAANVAPTEHDRAVLLHRAGRDRLAAGDQRSATDILTRALGTGVDSVESASIARTLAEASVLVEGADAALRVIRTQMSDDNRLGRSTRLSEVSMAAIALLTCRPSGHEADVGSTSGQDPQCDAADSTVEHALHAVTSVVRLDSRAVESAPAVRAAGELARRSLDGEVGAESSAALVGAIGLALLADIQAAETLAGRVAHSERNRGADGHATRAELVLADLRWRTGRWDEARRGLDAIEPLGAAEESDRRDLAVDAMRIRLAAGMGEEACMWRGRDLIAAAMDLQIWSCAAFGHAAICLFALGRGGHATAAEQALAVERLTTAGGWLEPAALMWHGDALEALLGTGDVGGAARIAAAVRSAAERSPCPWTVGLRYRCDALVTSDDGARLTACSRSIEVFEQIGAHFDVARSLLVRSELNLGLGDAEVARSDAVEASTIFSSLGAHDWKLRAARAALASSPGVAADPLAALSPAERRVTKHVARGLTNREIADTLYVSVKTVDFHLQRVYRKCGVRSRGQLSHLVHEYGLGRNRENA